MKAAVMIVLCLFASALLWAGPAGAQSLTVKLDGMKDNTLALNSSAAVVIMGGRPPFTVSSYNPGGLAVKMTSRGHTLTGKKPGTYFVRVTDAAKKSAVIQVTVVQAGADAGGPQARKPAREERPQAVKPRVEGEVN